MSKIQGSYVVMAKTQSGPWRKLFFVELHDFDTSTEKEQKREHLWLAFIECSIGI